MCSKAMSAAAIPVPTSSRPRQSSGLAVAAGPPRISLTANNNPMMPIGMLTKKIQRQDPSVAMAPPRTGATTGAVSAGQVSSAMARTRSALALKRSTASLPTGTIIAPPMPWSTRIATSIGSETLSAHPTDATVNTAIAAMNTGRMPNRSAVQPLAGINTATVSR
jgi:hypothetical protein